MYQSPSNENRALCISGTHPLVEEEMSRWNWLKDLETNHVYGDIKYHKCVTTYQEDKSKLFDL